MELTTKTQLYNLEEDISETNNLALEFPDIVQKMNVLFEENRTDTPGFPYGGVVQDYKPNQRYKANQK